VSVVTDAISRLHDDEVEPQRQPRKGRTIGQRPSIQEPKGGSPHSSPFSMIDGLLRQTE